MVHLCLSKMGHLGLSKMGHLGLSEVETAGNLGSLWQGQVLGALEPGRGKLLTAAETCQKQDHQIMT